MSFDFFFQKGSFEVIALFVSFLNWDTKTNFLDDAHWYKISNIGDRIMSKHNNDIKTAVDYHQFEIQ